MKADAEKIPEQANDDNEAGSFVEAKDPPAVKKKPIPGFLDFPLESINFYVAVQAFLQGLFNLCSLAVFMYQKEQLKLEPSVIQMASGILAIPWSVKPVIGYFLDQFLQRFKSAKPVFIATSVCIMILYSLVGHFTIPTVPFYILYFLAVTCVVTQNIVAEYLLCLTTQQESRETGTVKNNFPIYFGFRATGGLIGTFFGGRIINSYSLGTAFYITSFVPALIIISAMVHQEPNLVEEKEHRSFKEEVKVIGKLIFQKELLMLIICVVLVNISPNYDSTTTFFLTDVLKFSKSTLADLSTISGIFYIIGMFIYYKFLVDVSPKRLFLMTNLLVWVGNVSFMALVLEWVQNIGISPKFFCMLNYGITSFISELNSMPVMAIWTAYVPKGLEATSITLFTGINNLSSNLSNYTGTFIVWFLGITSTDLRKFWIALTIQNAYLIVVVVLIFFVPIAEPKIAKKTSETEIKYEMMEKKTQNVD